VHRVESWPASLTAWGRLRLGTIPPRAPESLALPAESPDPWPPAAERTLCHGFEAGLLPHIANPLIACHLRGVIRFGGHRACIAFSICETSRDPSV